MLDVHDLDLARFVVVIIFPRLLVRLDFWSWRCILVVFVVQSHGLGKCFNQYSILILSRCVNGYDLEGVFEDLETTLFRPWSLYHLPCFIRFQRRFRLINLHDLLFGRLWHLLRHLPRLPPILVRPPSLSHPQFFKTKLNRQICGIGIQCLKIDKHTFQRTGLGVHDTLLLVSIEAEEMAR